KPGTKSHCRGLGRKGGNEHSHAESSFSSTNGDDATPLVESSARRACASPPRDDGAVGGAHCAPRRIQLRGDFSTAVSASCFDEPASLQVSISGRGVRDRAERATLDMNGIKARCTLERQV